MTTSLRSFASDAALLASCLRMNVRALLASPSTFWMQAVFMAVNNLLFAVVWFTFFAAFPRVGGASFADLVALQGMLCTGWGLFVVVCGGARDLAKRMTDGSLDVWLVQPRPVLVQALGSRCIPSGFGDLLTGPAFLLFGGAFAAPDTALCALVGSLTAAIGLTAAAVAYGALACWLADWDSVLRQLLDYTLSFSLWPERIFGGPLRILLFTAIPAGFVSFLPYAALRDASVPAAFVALAAASAVLALAARVLDVAVRRHTAAAGTFTGG